ncbi:MAG: hypothetical protein SGCHY_003830 [Lobulomycetales sp.]
MSSRGERPVEIVIVTEGQPRTVVVFETFTVTPSATPSATSVLPTSATATSTSSASPTISPSLSSGGGNNVPTTVIVFIVIGFLSLILLAAFAAYRVSRFRMKRKFAQKNTPAPATESDMEPAESIKGGNRAGVSDDILDLHLYTNPRYSAFLDDGPILPPSLSSSSPSSPELRPEYRLTTATTNGGYHNSHPLRRIYSQNDVNGNYRAHPGSYIRRGSIASSLSGSIASVASEPIAGSEMKTLIRHHIAIFGSEYDSFLHDSYQGFLPTESSISLPNVPEELESSTDSPTEEKHSTDLLILSDKRRDYNSSLPLASERRNYGTNLPFPSERRDYNTSLSFASERRNYSTNLPFAPVRRNSNTYLPFAPARSNSNTNLPFAPKRRGSASSGHAAPSSASEEHGSSVSLVSGRRESNSGLPSSIAVARDRRIGRDVDEHLSKEASRTRKVAKDIEEKLGLQ